MFAVAIGQGLLHGLDSGSWVFNLLCSEARSAGFLLIPVVGALLIWAPVAIAYLISGTYWKALFLVSGTSRR
jgi:hypothetical protein